MIRFSAFDAATKTGVAYGRADTAPVLETWNLSRLSRGDVGLALMLKLNTHLQAYQPDMVFVEEPLPPVILAPIG